MELIKENMSINEDILRDFSNITVDGDIIVPDKKPDILKILQVDANTVIESKKVENMSVSISGKVCLKILYIPDRTEEKVKSIITELDFLHKIDNKDIKEDMRVICESDVQKVEFNIINSRKIGIKTIIGIDASVCGKRDISIVTDIEHDGYCEKETKRQCIYNILSDDDEEFVIRDKIEIASGKMSVSEVLKYDCRIIDKEVKVMSGKVILKGTMQSCVLYNGEDNNIDFMEAETPFTEVFEVFEAYEDALCDLDCNIGNVYAKVEEDSDGDMRVVNMEYIVKVHIRICKNIEIDMVSDFYCPGYETNVSREKCRLNEVICRPKNQASIREIFGLENNSVDRIYNVITKAYITNTTTEKGKINVQGGIDAYVLYLSENIDNPVSSIKKEIPFNYTLDAPSAENGMECIINADAEHTSYNINMANEVELRILLTISGRVIDSREDELICDADISEIDKDSHHGMVIYFVQKNDKLWDIAKRYHVAVEDISKMNEGIDKNSLKTGSRVIIPMLRKY